MRLKGWATAFVVVALAFSGVAQVPKNPVYVDDSPLAAETLGRVPELVAAGNEVEAVRALQRLLEDVGDKVIARSDDPDLFITVRGRVHGLLLDDPVLLERYRELEGPVAAARLNEDPAGVERTRLLTSAGFEATLRLAQTALESARFESCRLLLEQLETHPDRKVPASGAEAARLLAAAAAYLDRPEVWLVAERWAAEASIAAPARSATAWPEAALARPTGVLAEDHGIDMGDLPARALSSVALLPEPPSMEQMRGRRSMIGLPWVLPQVSGDLVVVNDGGHVWAMDRFTLTTLWREAIMPQTSRRVNAQRNRMLAAWDDQVFVRTVAIWNGFVLAATGGATNEGDPAEPVVYGLDLRTGQKRWRWLAEELGAEGRGAVPVVAGVEEGVLIVQLVRRLHDERIRSAQVLGLDPISGELLWRRMLGSVGALPFPPMSERRDAALLRHGVVFVGDGLGVTAAIEANSGRVRWVRRKAVGAMPGSEMLAPTAIVQPIVDGETIVTLSPDGLDVLRLDADTGRELGRRNASSLGWPRYLLRTGEWLVGVGSSRMTFVRIVEFENGEVRLGPTLSEQTPLARAIVSEGEVVLPVEGALLRVRPESPRVATAHAMAATGVLLGASGQLLVMDASKLHSVLVWPEAERVLKGRMAESPANADPAITLAELAHQSGRMQEVAPAVRQALAAIQRSAESGASGVDVQRDRLFASILTMLPDAGAETSALLELLGAVAATPAQHASHIFALGSFLEAQDRSAEAAGAYQRLLLDPAIAAITWRGSAISVRAELEATRRLRALAAQGIDLTRTDAQAAEALAALGDSPAPQAIERVARTFPAAPASMRAWLAAAEAHAEDRAAATRALRNGLDLVDALSLWDRPEAAEIAGRLVTLLLQDQREAEALAILDRLSDLAPELALTEQGQPVDTQTLLAGVAPRLRERQRLPLLGSAATGVAVLDGWRLELPARHAARTLDYCLARRGDDDDAAMELAAIEAGPTLRTRWVARFALGAEVVQADIDRILVVEPSQGSHRLVQLNAADGERIWETSPASIMFEALDVADVPRRQVFEAPLDGRVRSEDWVVAGDDRTLVVALRRG